MPYIDKEARKAMEEITPRTAGELNYVITVLIQKYLVDLHNCTYSDYNEVIGCLECVKQELYRRVVTPFEEKKKKENGDVF